MREGFGIASGWVWEAANFVNAGFWRLKAPETSICAPEGAFWPKKAFFHTFFTDFFVDFSGFSPFGAGYPSQKARLSSRDQVGC